MREITEDIDDGMITVTYTVDEQGIKNGPYKKVNHASDDEETGINKNGKPNGAYKKVHRGSYGNVLYAEEGSQKDGELHGIRKLFIYKEPKFSLTFSRAGVAAPSKKSERTEILSQEYENGIPVDGPFCWGEVWNDLKKGSYKKQKPDGEWREYDARAWTDDGYIRKDKEGALVCLKTYKEGVLDGPYWEPREGVRGQYKSGKKSGKWTKEAPDGSNEVISMNTFENGVPNGSFFEKVYNSELRKWIISEEGNRKNGKLDGVYTSYWPNGKIKKQCHYKDGKLSGNYAEYTSDGILIKKCHYENNALNGPYEEYTPAGILKKKGVYENNQFFTGNMKEKLNDRKRTNLKKILGVASILPQGNFRKKIKQTIAKVHKKISGRS